MSQIKDNKLFDHQHYDAEDCSDLAHQSCDALIGTTSGQACLPEPSNYRGSGSSGNRSKILLLAFIASCIAFIWLLNDSLRLNAQKEYQEPLATISLAKDAVQTPSPTPSATVLNVFQVYQPVINPPGVAGGTFQENGAENTVNIASTASAKSCGVLLMDHSFGFSYGKPFVGNYTPPSCKFNRVTMNFTVTSEGRQFDRLAIMYFNDTEVWRTSTAEPTASGIRWEYIKDMSQYMYLWNSPQKLIFDLGNLIDSTYTGAFNTTLTATFFNSPDVAEPASLIIPISARKGAESVASLFTLPNDTAINTVSFPQNANRAVFSISACGQATEEFWSSNVLQSNINTFQAESGTLYGYSPFREVQLLIDGQLAGVQWPFPVIFTGGVVPGLWRPMVGIDAFDLKEHEIDISPWLPILCNSKSHTFEIRVVGIIDDGNGSGTLSKTVGSSWYVTGKIFVWLDKDPKSVTSGYAPTTHIKEPVIKLSQSLTQNSTGANETLTYTTDVQRILGISSEIVTQNGSRLVAWTQNLAVTNYGMITDFGAVQINKQNTTGTEESLAGINGVTDYKCFYSYPFYINTSYIVQPSGNYTIDANLTLGLNVYFQGTPVFPTGLESFVNNPRSAPLVPGFLGTSLSTTLNGKAQYFASPSANRSSTFGSTNQEFSFKGTGASSGAADTELYYRSVEASNSTIVRDQERLVGVDIGTNKGPSQVVAPGYARIMSPKEALGRGPGPAKVAFVQGRNRNG